MSSFFESLESRALFSAAFVPNGWDNFTADLKSIRTEIASVEKTGHSEIKLLKQNLKGVSKGERAMYVSELSDAASSGLRQFRADEIDLTVLKAGVKTQAALGPEFDPGFVLGEPQEIAADQARVTAALSSVTQAVTADNTFFVTSLTTEAANLTSLFAGNTAIQSVATKITEDANSISTIISADLTNLHTDTTNLDYSGAISAAFIKRDR